MPKSNWIEFEVQFLRTNFPNYTKAIAFAMNNTFWYMNEFIQSKPNRNKCEYFDIGTICHAKWLYIFHRTILLEMTASKFIYAKRNLCTTNYIHSQSVTYTHKYLHPYLQFVWISEKGSYSKKKKSNIFRNANFGPHEHTFDSIQLLIRA